MRQAKLPLPLSPDKSRQTQLFQAPGSNIFQFAFRQLRLSNSQQREVPLFLSLQDQSVLSQSGTPPPRSSQASFPKRSHRYSRFRALFVLRSSLLYSPLYSCSLHTLYTLYSLHFLHDFYFPSSYLPLIYPCPFWLFAFLFLCFLFLFYLLFFLSYSFPFIPFFFLFFLCFFSLLCVICCSLLLAFFSISFKSSLSDFALHYTPSSSFSQSFANFVKSGLIEEGDSHSELYTKTGCRPVFKQFDTLSPF